MDDLERAQPRWLPAAAVHSAGGRPARAQHATPVPAHGRDAGYPADQAAPARQPGAGRRSGQLRVQEADQHHPRVPPLRFVRELACVDPEAAPSDRRYDAPTTGPCRARLRPSPLLATSTAPTSRTPSIPTRPGSERLTASRTCSTPSDPHAAHRPPSSPTSTSPSSATRPTRRIPTKPYGLAQQARFINWAEYLAYKNPQVRSWPQFMLRDLGVVSAEKAARGAPPVSASGRAVCSSRTAGPSPRPPVQGWRCSWTASPPRGPLLGERGPARPAPAGAVQTRARRRGAKTRARRRGARAQRRRPGRRLVIWGHVRTGGAQRVVLEESGGGSPAWRQARTAATAGAR